MTTHEGERPDFWIRIARDDRLANARRKLSMDELRMLFQHARDSVSEPPRPTGDVVKLVSSITPYSSIVGGGLTLRRIDGRAGFIVNFIGTSEGITPEETAALSAQFEWFVSNFGCAVPSRSSKPHYGTGGSDE